MKSFLIFLTASLLLAFSVNAYAADAILRKVTVVGNAVKKIAPDEMNWVVQVSINDSTLAKAKDRHDASLTAALKFIKSLSDSVKDLQTGGIRFDKNIYAPENSPAASTPYSCSTQFTFTLTDFEKYGPIADALSKLDGLQIQSVDYASTKQQATQLDALKLALADAHNKANGLAETANCYIDKPLEIIEGGADNGPRPMMRMMASDKGTPAAVPGQLEISASVTATYDLYYK